MVMQIKLIVDVVVASSEAREEADVHRLRTQFQSCTASALNIY